RPQGLIQGWLDRWMPKSQLGNAAVAAGIAALIGGAAAAVSVEVFSTYGWTLFVATPFGMGFLASLLYGYHQPRNFTESISVAVLSTFILSLGFLGMAFEGVFCLVMAAPIGLFLAVIGGTLGYVIQGTARLPRALWVLLLFYPGLMGMEVLGKESAPVFEVRSS